MPFGSELLLNCQYFIKFWGCGYTNEIFILGLDPTNFKKVQKQEEKSIENVKDMACQKVCKQGGDDIKIDKALYLHLFTLQLL